MDRSTRLFLAEAILERTRDYPRDALNDLFGALDKIEVEHNLVTGLTPEEEDAVAAAEAKLARGKHLPELEAPAQNDLEASKEDILNRLAVLPDTEQYAVYGVIALLLDVDAPRPRMTPAEIADLRRTLREIEE